MIALFGCCADSNALVALDVPGLFDDEGEPIDAFFRPAPLTVGPVNAFSKLRQIAQAVTIGGPVSVRVTPIVDGATAPDQAQDYDLATPDGLDQRIESPVAIEGTRFSFELAVTAQGGTLQFGEGAMVVVEKRRNTGR